MIYDNMISHHHVPSIIHPCVHVYRILYSCMIWSTHYVRLTQYTEAIFYHINMIQQLSYTHQFYFYTTTLFLNLSTCALTAS